MFRLTGTNRPTMTLLLAVILIGHGLPPGVQAGASQHSPTSRVPGPADSAAVVQAIERFHRALQGGDSIAALSLLARDVAILESGDQETREQYRNHHLASDIEFSRAVPGRITSRQGTMEGDVAWVASQGMAQGEFRDRSIDAATTELMVLTRSGGQWMIRAIHWSSRSRVAR